MQEKRKKMIIFTVCAMTLILRRIMVSVDYPYKESI